MVEDILARNNITSAPVDVELVATSLGIIIMKDDVSDDISGFLYRQQGKTIIGANKNHHIHRQRFTIAHECGHYFLHEGETVHLDSGNRAFRINLRDEQSSKGDDNDEREANLFAAELLMPAKFLAKDLQGRDLDLFDEKELIELAKKYKVSLQALTFRLANLGFIQP